MGIRSLSSASISTGAKRSKFWDQGTFLIPNAYASLANVTISTTTSAVEITNIPTSGFRHLEVRGIWVGTHAGSDSLRFQLNGDSGNNYYSHFIYGNGADLSGGNNAGGSILSSGYMAYKASATDGSYDSTAFVLKIPDYVSTSKKRSWQAIDGRAPSSGAGHSQYASGVYSPTGSAITSIKFLCVNGSIAANSRFSVYGIKG